MFTLLRCILAVADRDWSLYLPTFSHLSAVLDHPYFDLPLRL